MFKTCILFVLRTILTLAAQLFSVTSISKSDHVEDLPLILWSDVRWVGTFSFSSKSHTFGFDSLENSTFLWTELNLTHIFIKVSACSQSCLYPKAQSAIYFVQVTEKDSCLTTAHLKELLFTTKAMPPNSIEYDRVFRESRYTRSSSEHTDDRL